MKLCRICGGTEELKCFEGNEQLTQLLEVCANITIQVNDLLPKHICEQCEFGLRFSYRLRKQGEETEKRLRQEMQCVTTTTDSVEEVTDADYEEESIEIMRESLLPDPQQNVGTSTNALEKASEFEGNVQSASEIIATKRLCLELKEQQVSTSTTEIVEEETVGQPHGGRDEESLRLQLESRGVTMCTRTEAEINGLLRQQINVPYAIVDQRSPAEYERRSMSPYTKLGDVEAEQQDDVKSDCDLAGVQELFVEDIRENQAMDDVIELVDDESSIADSIMTYARASSGNVCELLNEGTLNSQDIIERILSSDEEEELKKSFVENKHLNAIKIDGQHHEYYTDQGICTGSTDVVCEALVEECHEAVSIDECQIYFTKEENEEFVYEEDMDEEVVRSEGNEIILHEDDVLSLENGIQQEEDLDEVFGAAAKATPGKVLISSYTCPTCNLRLKNQREYRSHIKEHGAERYLCLECNKWFPTHFRLKAHEKTHQINVQKLQCPHCDRSYQLRCNLTRHIRNIHEKHRYICAICGESFGRPDVLNNHMIKHTEERDFRCHQCQESFKSKRYLVSHMRKHSKLVRDDHGSAKNSENKGTEKNTYYCHYCGKKSKHHFTHKMHMRIHTQERPHKCEACGKAFRTLAALITHERIHDDVRPYQCDYCLLSFRQQGHLKEHRMIHEGITPHACSICNVAFTKKNNMLVHMRIHSGENPYKCVICGEQFKKSLQLRSHERIVHGKVDVKTDGANGDLFRVDDEYGQLSEEDQAQIGVSASRIRVGELAADLLCSNSNDMKDTENTVPSIGDNCMVDEIVIKDIEMQTKTTCVDLEPPYCADLSTDFDVETGGVMLVVDDNAKFNSLYIMDD